MVGDVHRRESSVQRLTCLSTEVFSAQPQRRIQIRIERQYNRSFFDLNVCRDLLMQMLPL